MASNTAGGDPQEEETVPWHALPGVIGDLIVNDGPGYVGTGGYLVSRTEEDDIEIYRELEMAESQEELEDIGDYVHDWGEYYSSNELVCTLPAPEGGWEEEIHQVSEESWGGYE